MDRDSWDGCGLAIFALAFCGKTPIEEEIMSIVQALIAGFAGKVLGKVAEWVPSKAEARRNSLVAYKKERDELLKKPDNEKNNARMSYLAERIRVLEQAASNT